MLKKKKYLVIILLIIIICIIVCLICYFRYKRSIKQHVKFEEILVMKVDNPDEIEGKEYIYNTTSKKELKQWGINVDDTLLQEYDFLMYSLDYKITDIWYNKYAPEYFYGDGFKTGPIMLKTKYEKDKENYLHVYVVRNHFLGIYDYFQMR